MLLATLRNVGGSVMVAIPRPLLDGLGLSANTKVGLTIDHGKLVIEPTSKPQYTLSELIAQCDPEMCPDPVETAWQMLPMYGDEAI